MILTNFFYLKIKGKKSLKIAEKFTQKPEMFIGLQRIALDVSYGFRKYSPVFLIVVFLVQKSVHNFDQLSDHYVSLCEKKLIIAFYNFSDQRPFYIFGPTTFFGPTTLRTNDPSDQRSTSEANRLRFFNSVTRSWIFQFLRIDLIRAKLKF